MHCPVRHAVKQINVKNYVLLLFKTYKTHNTCKYTDDNRDKNGYIQ